MKVKFLLPHSYAAIGWIITIPTLILGLIWPGFDQGPELFNVEVYSIIEIAFNDNVQNNHFFMNNIFDEILGILLITGLFMIAFARVKNEDELISRLRMESLIWALYWNYGLLILAIVFIYDLAFFNVMLVNMFLILVLFIIRFRYYLFQLKRG